MIDQYAYLMHDMIRTMGCCNNGISIPGGYLFVHIGLKERLVVWDGKYSS